MNTTYLAEANTKDEAIRKVQSLVAAGQPDHEHTFEAIKKWQGREWLVTVRDPETPALGCATCSHQEAEHNDYGCLECGACQEWIER